MTPAENIPAADYGALGLKEVTALSAPPGLDSEATHAIATVGPWAGWLFRWDVAGKAWVSKRPAHSIEIERAKARA